MKMVEVKGLTKTFGEVIALNKVELTIEKGMIYGFIGPNGAGKSTTLRILLGILKPNSGKIQIFGKDAWKDAVEIHRKVAYVPGDVRLWPNLTGGEVIDLLLKMHGSFQQEKRDELISRFDLDPSKKCRTYSKGNRQKIALIAAFAAEADLYILDEPTSGLDPLMERIFQDLILGLKAEGKTVLLSSHILSEVEKVCDRVAIIREGKIVEEGSLEDLQHLTRSQITMETREPIPDLAGIFGVHEVQKAGAGWSFQVDTEEMDSVFRILSRYGILKLESRPPQLEDLFLRHYNENFPEMDPSLKRGVPNEK